MDQLKDKLSGLKGVLNAPGNALNAICDGARYIPTKFILVKLPNSNREQLVLFHP